MPGLVSGKYTDRDVFYSSYVQTYIDRDVTEQIQLTDKLLFRDFIRAAACRAGQMLNIHDIASDVGVSNDTAKRWLQVLEKSDIIFFLRPYSNNLLKRTVQTPVWLPTSPGTPLRRFWQTARSTVPSLKTTSWRRSARPT